MKNGELSKRRGSFFLVPVLQCQVRFLIATFNPGCSTHLGIHILVLGTTNLKDQPGCLSKTLLTAVINTVFGHCWSRWAREYCDFL